MDSENKNEERRDWREDRRRWREERRRRLEERGKYYRERWMVRHHSGGGNIWTGIFLLIIGGVYLLKVTIPDQFPEWMWNWPMLLIALGFFIGIRHNFRGGAWFILMIVGGAFLITSQEFTKQFPDLKLGPYLWPAALILLGLFFIFKPRHHHRYWKEDVDNKVDDKIESAVNSENKGPGGPTSGEDYIDTTSIFGGVKKNIISKNFKGGDITNIMGGSEIDLTQADINGTVTIDLTQVFGGTKLIVPSNWQVKAQIAAIFGGVEDKRSVQNTAIDPNKLLILDGTSIFGGIEIRSY
jgi:predicted membrane protein